MGSEGLQGTKDLGGGDRRKEGRKVKVMMKKKKGGDQRGRRGRDVHVRRGGWNGGDGGEGEKDRRGVGGIEVLICRFLRLLLLILLLPSPPPLVEPTRLSSTGLGFLLYRTLCKVFFILFFKIQLMTEFLDLADEG